MSDLYSLYDPGTILLIEKVLQLNILLDWITLSPKHKIGKVDSIFSRYLFTDIIPVVFRVEVGKEEAEEGL